jgi:CRISPR/Cas system-associated exonuclease Cas4 (RecB family)
MARNSLKSICRLIDQANDKLPPAQSFLTDLKKSIEMTADEDRRKPSQTYKPSSMKCIRNMYYQRAGVTPDEELSSYCSVGICNSGSDIHIRIQTAVENMKKHGIDCEYIDVAEYVKSRNLDYLEIVSKSGMETKLFHKTLNMSFMCDGIIRYNNHYYILEIKTEASFKWSARTDTDPAHYAQGTAYSVAFQLPEVMFLYINRDILDMKAYLFVPTNEMKENLVGTIEDCEGYVNRMICPPKPEDLPRNVCNYCSYKTQCRKDG